MRWKWQKCTILFPVETELSPDLSIYHKLPCLSNHPGLHWDFISELPPGLEPELLMHDTWVSTRILTQAFFHFCRLIVQLPAVLERWQARIICTLLLYVLSPFIWLADQADHWLPLYFPDTHTSFHQLQLTRLKVERMARSSFYIASTQHLVEVGWDDWVRVGACGI